MVVPLILAIVVISVEASDRKVIQAEEIQDMVARGYEVSLSDAVIVGYLNLSEINTVDLPMSFIKCSIEGDINCSNIVFKKPVTFSQTDFKGSADFNYAYFENGADFSRANFNDAAYFYKATFGTFSSFAYAIFGSNSDFEKTWFGPFSSFYGTTFRDDVNFAGAKFSIAMFSWATFEKNANFEKGEFGKDVTFTNTTFKGYVSGWSALEKGDFDDVTHLTLIQNLKIHGQFNDADNCYYAYRNGRISSIIDLIALISCGFGVRPTRTLLLSLILIGVFAYAYTYSNGVHKPKGFISLTLPDALYFSVLVFFVALPPPAWEVKDRWRYVIMAEDILGWFLTTLFIVTLGNVMIR